MENVNMFDRRRDNIMRLTYLANVDIDKSKHSDVDNTDQTELLIRDVRQERFPNFVRYTQSTKKDINDPKRDPEDASWNKHCVKTNSFLDKHCDSLLEKTTKELEIEGANEMYIRVKGNIAPYDAKYVKGLCCKGKFNYQTKKYENEGLFNKMVFDKEIEWTYKAYEHPECKTSIELKALEAREIIEKHVAKINQEENKSFTWMDAYSTCATFAFNECSVMSVAYQEAFMPFFFAVFSKDMEEFMLDKLGQEALDNMYEIDDCWDDDEEDYND